MREQIERRLLELRAEMENGQKMLAELEAKEAHLRSTLLRISGAIQALEELLNADSPQSSYVSGPLSGSEPPQ